MRRILLDTSAYSSAQRGVAQTSEFLRHASDIAMSPVALGELLQGFLGGSERLENEARLRLFLRGGRVKVLDITEETATRYAIIAKTLRDRGEPIPTNDVWIAASAMEHGMVVVTADAHFLRVPQIAVELVPARQAP